ncbi:hydrolase 76 protein [Phlyctochytrium bullatum]|nr:hydrolase 76 protein [Phlyctochytrium bullatum]
MRLSVLSGLLVAFGAVVSANTLDLTSKDAVDAAIRKGMRWLNYYYLPDGRGAWNDDIVQWHESAIYFDTYMRYRKYFGDSAYDDFVNSEMIASTNGDIGNFIREAGSEGVEVKGWGRWNDDVGWWGLTAMTGAEIWGPSALVDPSGPKPGRPWLEIANRTLYMMTEHLDDACGSGIYWSRWRSAPDSDKRRLKSSITNVEAMELAARIHAVRPDPALQRLSDDLYLWMKGGLFGDNYTVFDGVFADDAGVKDLTCGRINVIQWSYQWGPLLSALSTWYTNTKNRTYLDEAHKFYDTFAATFLDAKGAYDTTEWGCRLASCKTPTGFAWPVLKGLAYLYAVSDDEKRKTSMRNAVAGHAQGVVEKCRDPEWNCVGTIALNTKYSYRSNGTNPRDQFELIESLLSLSVILGSTPKQEIQTGAVTTRTRTVATEPTGASGGGGGGGNNAATGRGVGIVVVAGAVLAVAALLVGI